MTALRSSSGRPPDPRLVLLAADEARVELVDVELAVEAEVLGIRAKESLDVRLGGQDGELLVLECPQVLPADLRRELCLCEVEPAPLAGLTRLFPISNTAC